MEGIIKCPKMDNEQVGDLQELEKGKGNELRATGQEEAPSMHVECICPAVTLVIRLPLSERTRRGADTLHSTKTVLVQSNGTFCGPAKQDLRARAFFSFRESP
jgi:hypothetical protein